MCNCGGSKGTAGSTTLRSMPGKKILWRLRTPDGGQELFDTEAEAYKARSELGGKVRQVTKTQ